MGGKAAPGKAETALLPPFAGLAPERISIPASPAEYAAAVAAIRASGAVGFDTETKPVFAKGVVRPGPDLAQFATGDHAFLFQLQRRDGWSFLVEILGAADILKVGFDLRSDRSLLQQRLGIEVQGVLDLVTVFRRRGYRNTTGIRAAVGIVLHQGFHKAKRWTTSDWSRLDLHPKQREYAANDAYAAFRVWDALGRPRPGRQG
ncbi:MAG: 3'-5' exonuclease domain-containing protein 2 [Candidatus Riflebacteria bacterium]|nr:3'-5' exonuclease domain-containing protein 2 [Candidatus Riflebacteria bacterium]